MPDQEDPDLDVAYSPLSEGDLIPNATVAGPEEDEFEHEQVAARISQLITAVDPPTNIALFGPWGSGKSSILPLLKAQFKGQVDEPVIVPYDAWRFSGTSLKRTFVTNAARHLSKDPERSSTWVDQTLYENSVSARFPWRPVLGRLLLALVIAALALGCIGSIYGFTGEHPFWKDFRDGLQSTRGWVGPVLLFLVGAIPFIEFMKVTVTRPAPQDDEQFVDVFDEALKQAGGKRVVFFVDELDRCAPNAVLETLIAIKTFLERKNCIFIVAADRDVLVQALDAPEHAANDGLRQATPLREFEPYYSTAGAFLDKMFQHQVELPPLRKHTLGGYARKIAAKRAGGVWEELKDSGRLDRVVYALIPAHVRSPRRVKVLMNNFAVNARIAESRHIPWLEQAEQIAKLTVLRTEFPKFAQHLLLEPRLVEALEKPDGSDTIAAARTERFKTLFAYYQKHGGDDLLPDGPDEDPRSDQAEQTLVTELRSYLAKTAYAHVRGPSRSLLHMEPVGTREGLSDEALSDVIDEAAEHPPIETVSSFEHPSDAKIAAEILVREFDDHVGPGLTAVIETVCRLAEIMDDQTLVAAAPRIAAATLEQVENDTESPGSLPGAFRIATTAGVTASLNALFFRLARFAARPDDFPGLRIGAVTSQLPRFNAQDAEKFADVLFGVYKAGLDGPLLTALADVDEDCFDALWQRTSSQLIPFLGTEPAATSDGEVSLERCTHLLDALYSRHDEVSGIHMDALALLLGDGPIGAYDIVRDRAEMPAESSADDAATSLGLQGLIRGPATDWPFWIELVRSSWNEPLRVRALEHVIDAIDVGDPDQVQDLSDVVGAIARYGFAETGSGEALARRLGARLQESTWGDDASSSQIHKTIDRVLDALTDDAALRSELRSDEVERAIGADRPSPTTVDVVKYLKSLEADDLVAIDSRLNAVHGDAPASVHALRVHIATRRLGGTGPAFPTTSITGLSAPSTSTAAAANFRDAIDSAVNEWILTDPPFSEIKAVVDHHGVQPSSLAVYSQALTSLRQRHTVWKFARENGFDKRVVDAIAKPGLPHSSLTTWFSAASDSKSNQEARDAIVDELIRLPLQTEDLLAPTSDLVELLLTEGYKGDARNAARLALKAGSLKYGYQQRVRAKFNGARGNIPRPLQEQLILKRLMDKSPKKSKRSTFGRLVDAVAEVTTL